MFRDVVLMVLSYVSYIFPQTLKQSKQIEQLWVKMRCQPLFWKILHPHNEENGRSLNGVSGGGFYSETSGVTEKHVAKNEVILCAGRAPKWWQMVSNGHLEPWKMGGGFLK